MLPAKYLVSFRPYGLSDDASSDAALPAMDASLTLAELYANQVDTGRGHPDAMRCSPSSTS